MKEKRNLIIFIIVIAIVIVTIIGIKSSKNKKQEEENKEEFVQVLDDGTKLNISEELKETKKIDGVQITNIQLTEKNGQSVVLADATNTTEKDTPVIGIYIVMVDKQGNEIAKIPGVISPLKPGATKQLNVGVTEDYANAYDFKVEKQ